MELTAPSPQEVPPLELTLRQILSRNMALRLLLAGGYRWMGLAVVLAVGYFLAGFTVAFLTNSLSLLLQERPVYTTLLGIILGVMAACWFPPLLIEVVASIPLAFDVDQQTTQALAEHWVRNIRLPISLTTAFITIVLALIYAVVQDISVGVDLLSPMWFTIYRYILVASGAFIAGGGLAVFLLTIKLFHSFFQYKLNLARYRYLHPLNRLSTGLTIFGLLAVALVAVPILNRIDLSSLVLVGMGILTALLSFVIPQISYQSAVVRAKRTYLYRIDGLFERYYQVLEQNTSTNADLKEAKEAVEAIEVLKASIGSIPTWLIDLSDVSKILLATLAPIMSLIINLLITNWLHSP